MDVCALLDARGISYESKGGAEISIVCPAQANHSDGLDSNASFNINTQKLVGHCFACGYSLNEVQLAKWLLGEALDEEQLQCLSIRSKLKKLLTVQDPVLVEEEEFTYMPPGKAFDYEYRGISVDTYRMLGAIECQVGRYQNRICFPITQHNRTQGVDARALGSDMKPKYLRPSGANAKQWLYPFDLAKKQKIKQGILCEGIYHAINYLDKIGRAEALCYFGCNNWSDHKTLLLLELGLNRVIFWPDNDTAGIKAMNEICPQLTQWLEVYYIPPDILPEPDRDLGDFTRDEIEQFMNQKRRWNG